jgi:hypothetical protein
MSASDPTIPSGPSVIATSDPDQLPPELAQLLDATRPIPPGTRFFEEAFTLGGMARALLVGLLLVPLGLLVGRIAVMPFHMSDGSTRQNPYMIYELAFAAACLIGAWLLLGSLRGRWRAMRAQQAGRGTRYGVFLLPNAILLRGMTDILAVPRGLVTAVREHRLHYLRDGKPRNDGLPKRLVGQPRESLEQAMQAWAAGR